MNTQMETAAVSVANLAKVYGTARVVDGVSFQLHYGEILGVLGPNGAGKTTTVGMLYGAVRKTSGAVNFGALEIASSEREIKETIGVVTQEDRLDNDFTVIENLTQFAHRHGLTGRRAVSRAEDLLEELGIECFKDFSPERLSGGMKRRVVLARSLMHSPRVLFLDEPTTGLDPDARQDFWERITKFREEGYAILLTTHYMDEAEKLCDRLLLMQRGRIIDEGTPREIILRHAGEDALEIEGLEEEKLAPMVPGNAVFRSLFDGGFYVSIPGDSVKELWKPFHDLDLPGLKRRKCNLEDVFLQMTGRGLE